MGQIGNIRCFRRKYKYDLTIMTKLIDQSVAPRRETAESQQATQRLQDFIDGGDYVPGDRLPSERDMISNLGIRRNILRKALDTLERRGVIWRHVGKGTFLANRDGTGDLWMIDALSQNITPLRMVQARLCIEPALAREAAIHASREANARIRSAREAAKAAKDWAEYETKDDLFHRAVAESSDNALLLLLFDQLNHVRRAVADTSVVRGTTRPPDTHSSFAEHDLIAQTIAAHDPQAAYSAMRAHIGSVSDRLFGD